MSAAVQRRRDALRAARPTARDPVVERLVGPGKRFQLEETVVAGVAHEVVAGAPRTLGPILARAATLGDRALVVQGEARLTYEEGFARAAALAEALRTRFGVGRGDRVALAAGSRPEWIVALVAVIAAGGVAVLVNTRGVGEEMLHAIATAGCTLAILDVERAEAIAAVSDDPPWPRIVFEGEDGAGPLRPEVDAAFDDLARPTAGAAALQPLAMEPEDGALVLFTSGTTGRPKGALLSHGAVAHAISLSSLMGAVQDLRYAEEIGAAAGAPAMASPVVLLTPLFHLTGVLPTLRGLGQGAPIHIVAKWNAEAAFDLIETAGLSRLAFVPTMLFDMLASPRATPQALAAIRHLAYGGAPINLALVEEVRRRMPGSLITNTYGQSENAGWACSLSGAPYLDHPRSCGWAVPTVQVCALREDGSLAGVGEVGELWVRSAGNMSGYIGDPQATAEALEDGWCASGDLGSVDADGLFTVVDRKKNMVISGGENIYCAEVERVLYDHEAVREAIAYGEPDPRLGERMVATVVLEPHADASEDELKAYCRGRLALYKTPRGIETTREGLPRTASGKIDRATFLRRRLQARASGPHDSAR